MSGYYCGEGAAEAANNVDAIFISKFCHTAKFVQYFHGGFKPDAQVCLRSIPLRGDATTNAASSSSPPGKTA